MTRRPCYSALAACIVAAALAPRAAASGFQLREQSPSAQGTAFAGVSAGGADLGGMFFNPATMALIQGNQAVLGASYVEPDTKLGNGSGHRAAAFGGGVISGPATTGNAAQNALLPNLYAMWSATPDLKLGLSVNAPFGMGTDYDASFVGRYHALKSDLSVVDIAPTLAYRVNPQWSFGLALVARKADAELSNGMDFGSIVLASSAIPAPLKAGVTPGGLDGTATLKGSKWGYGYRLGVLFEPSDKVRLGLSYHSATKMNLGGDASFAFPATMSPTLAGALQAGGFRNNSATAELNLPSMASLGVQVAATPTLTVHGEISRTGWSTFKELRVKFSSGLPESVTEENWRDTWFYALGLSWQATEAWTLRTGLAYDQGAVPDADRTPRIPDGNRTWVSVGAGYAFSRTVSMDLAYTHIFVTDGKLDLKAVPDGYTTSTSPNTFRGDLSGDYTNSIDIIAAQVRFTF